jgi:cytochrome P450
MLLSTIAIIIVVLVAVILLYNKYSENKYIQLITHIKTGKSPMKVSLIETISSMIFSKEHYCTNSLEYAKKSNFEPFVQFVGPLVILTISDVDMAKKILLNSSDFPKYSFPSEFLDMMIGQGLVMLNGDEWKWHREIVNPAFYNIDRFVPLFAKQVSKCLSIMGQKATIPAHSFCTKLTLDALGAASFGYNFGSLDDSNSEYLEAYEIIMRNMTNLPAVLFGKKYTSLPLESNKKIFNSIDLMNQLVYDMIQKSRDRSDDSTEDLTLLDLMVKGESNTGNKMSDRELRNNIMTFFIAGHDTTSTALAFGLYALAKHQHVQTRAREEIESTIGLDPSKELTVEDLKKLDYVSWMINETLRCYPPVVFAHGRDMVNKSEILGSYKVKKGLRLSVNIYNIHHNPQYWDNPDEYDPERFSPERKKGRPTLAFLPFGAGSRVCMGYQFSILEQKIFLTRLLQSFTVELPDRNYEVKLTGPDFMIQPSKDLKIIVKPLVH